MTQAFRAIEAGAKGRENHLAFMEPTPKRIRVTFAGETIADSTNVLVMQETNHQPVYYFPMNDVRMDLMVPTDNSTT